MTIIDTNARDLMLRINEKKENAMIKLTKLKALNDPEVEHSRADIILCEFLEELGFDDLVKAYHEIQPKWYA